MNELARTLMQGLAQALGWRVANLMPTWMAVVLACLAAVLYIRG